MSLCKWSCICFLGGLILIGWPAAVSCESSLEDKHPPGVKECRVHIEKALEEYWDKKEPEEISNPNEDSNAHHLDESDLNEEEENIGKDQRDSSHLETPDDIKDDDDENHNDEDNDDDEETDDNEDHNDDVETEDNEEDDNDVAEAEDDEEDTSDDEEAEDNVQETENTNDNADEEEDDEEEEAEIDNENEEEESKGEDEDNDNEDDDDDENDEKSEDANGNEQDDDEIEQTASSISSETSEQDDDDDTDLHEDDENDENETKPKEESTESEETDMDSEENKEDEESVDEDDEEGKENDDDGEEEESDVEKSALDESSKTESDSSPEEHEAESGKATDEAPEEEVSPEVEPDSAEDTSEAESEEEEKEEDDSIENIYEEEEEEEPEPHSFRSREHIDVILGIDEIGTSLEKDEEKMAQSVFRDIKKIETTQIKPVELLYKYADSTTRVLGDAEIFSKPMLLFLGPWGAGKTSIINYLLGLERTPSALKTGSTGITDVDFSLLTYGAQRRIVSGTELAADWKYAGVQKFGQGFLDHFRSIHIPHPLLQKQVTIVDTPGIVENRKNAERGYSLNAAFQWFIDRADAVYVVLDPSKVDIGGELGSVIEQLQGQNVRFLLNKADSIRRSDLMRVVGQLFWNLSPLLGGAEAPLIYAVSLTSHPYHPSAPAKFLADQEKNFLYDMKSTLDKRVENKILYARKHAVRVRNHAKMVDCYLASYYRHKSIFSNKRNVAKLITENPREYNIYDGLTGMTNVSRSDVPNPLAYKEFFKIHPLYDFKPLASTCSYFRGCPMDKVDLAITKEFPELLAKYKEAKRALYGHLEQDR
ncbi:unnamed protein product [Larinioides sclopetarius]|uniref:G domain-containing protein n=1 Tax=Larinioides sclopetarius TaxID=280406 RepID=A0AAV1YTH7_9ARAC